MLYVGEMFSCERFLQNIDTKLTCSQWVVGFDKIKRTLNHHKTFRKCAKSFEITNSSLSEKKTLYKLGKREKKLTENK